MGNQALGDRIKIGFRAFNFCIGRQTRQVGVGLLDEVIHVEPMRYGAPEPRAYLGLERQDAGREPVSTRLRQHRHATLPRSSFLTARVLAKPGPLARGPKRPSAMSNRRFKPLILVLQLVQASTLSKEDLNKCDTSSRQRSGGRPAS